MVEPHLKHLPARLTDFQNVHLTDIEDALRKADIVAFLVKHKVFSSITAAAVNEKIVFDICGM